MKKGYRIISIEAKEIYTQEQINGADVGYRVDRKHSEYYYNKLFKNVLDYSLDTIELESAYKRIYRKKFFFTNSDGYDCTLAVINVKFSRVYKDNGIRISKKKLREYFYDNGFTFEGIHYVRYKRSAGSSREGNCLFIDDRLYKAMTKWSECGLKSGEDLASWEAYKALSLSSIIGTITIPLEGILFVPDYKSVFSEEVVAVSLNNERLVAEQKQTKIVNDIWDGESLLDESLFSGAHADKHMLLLRNKFFKSCAFRTKLQKWINDKNITLDDLAARGFITLATDISQIVMVTTPNSLKYLKFAGKLTKANIAKWVSNAGATFGVVKTDKSTRFFHGKMVQSSYQLLNTIGFIEAQTNAFLQPSINHIALIRSDIDFMRYNFTDIYSGDYEENDEEKKYGLAERAHVIFELLKCNPEFDKTKLYANFCKDVVSTQKKRLKRGAVLLNGTNATLFGNGPELLKFIAGEEVVSALGKGQIRCTRFADKEELLCARSPHITMGNLYLAQNNLSGDIWNYFDLGDNIVCVNAIGENIQQCLNGCDYDSDTMLITDNKLMVETAKKYSALFKVPVCNIPSTTKTNTKLSALDYDTSENKIGEIVNLSQRLNSIIWDKLNSGVDEVEVLSVYNDACKLAVMSGIEIDKAKRAYDNVHIGKELVVLRKKYKIPKPLFFEKLGHKHLQTGPFAFHKTTMDYIYVAISNLQFRKGRERRVQYFPISHFIDFDDSKCSATDYRHKDRVVELLSFLKQDLHLLYQELEDADEDEKVVIYDKIADTKENVYAKLSNLINTKKELMLIIRHYEKNRDSDWRIYAAIFNNEIYKKLVFGEKIYLKQVVESDDGEYELYGMKFAKIG